MNKKQLSWEEIHNKSNQLSKKLSNYDFVGIIAIARGGLIPAGIVSTGLNIRLVDTISIASYYEQEQCDSKILKFHSDSLTTGKNWLVVEDLVDTGTTAKIVKELLPDCYFACLYAKPKALDIVDCFVEQIEQDTWLDFPWEADQSINRETLENFSNECGQHLDDGMFNDKPHWAEDQLELMEMARRYKSDAFSSIYETMQSLHDVGAISNDTMSHFDYTCLDPDYEKSLEVNNNEGGKDTREGVQFKT